MSLRLLALVVAAVPAMWLGGCVEPDLGSAPFYCNGGSPECPEGYICTKVDGVGLCVRPGFTPQTPASGVDAGDGGPATTPDTSAPPVKWDKGIQRPEQSVAPSQDKGTTTPTGIGCLTDTECSTVNPAVPCCCPDSLLVWTCKSICLFTLCM